MIFLYPTRATFSAHPVTQIVNLPGLYKSDSINSQQHFCKLISLSPSCRTLGHNFNTSQEPLRRYDEVNPSFFWLQAGCMCFCVSFLGERERWQATRQTAARPFRNAGDSLRRRSEGRSAADGDRLEREWARTAPAAGAAARKRLCIQWQRTQHQQLQRR